MATDRLYVVALGALMFSVPFLLIAHIGPRTRRSGIRIAMLSTGLLLAALALALWIVALRSRPPCLESHGETSLQPMLVGDVTILMPMEYEICDRRAPEKQR